MENKQEQKKMLFNAGSEEEFKTLLADQVSEEEAVLLWQEIQKMKESGEFMALDDNTLDEVNGGIKIVNTKYSSGKYEKPDILITKLWELIFG